MNISVKAVLLDMRRIPLFVTCAWAQTNVLRTTRRDILATQGLSGEFSNPNIYNDALVLTRVLLGSEMRSYSIGLLSVAHIRMRDFPSKCRDGV